MQCTACQPEACQPAQPRMTHGPGRPAVSSSAPSIRHASVFRLGRGSLSARAHIIHARQPLLQLNFSFRAHRKLDDSSDPSIVHRFQWLLFLSSRPLRLSDRIVRSSPRGFEIGLDKKNGTGTGASMGCVKIRTDCRAVPCKAAGLASRQADCESARLCFPLLEGRTVPLLYVT